MNRKITKEEKIIRLLDYLKKYTDQSNPASIPQIDRYFKAQGYPNFFGSKDTRKNLIKAMVVAINSDIDGNLLPREQWRVIYDDFSKEYTDEKSNMKRHHIVNIFYNQPFSDTEIQKIANSIKNNTQLSEDERKILIEKVMSSLANDNYMKHPLTPAKRRALELDKQRSEAWGQYLLQRKLKARDWYYD